MRVSASGRARGARNSSKRFLRHKVSPTHRCAGIAKKFLGYVKPPPSYRAELTQPMAHLLVLLCTLRVCSAYERRRRGRFHRQETERMSLFSSKRTIGQLGNIALPLSLWVSIQATFACLLRQVAHSRSLYHPRRTKAVPTYVSQISSDLK